MKEYMKPSLTKIEITMEERVAGSCSGPSGLGGGLGLGHGGLGEGQQKGDGEDTGKGHDK